MSIGDKIVVSTTNRNVCNIMTIDNIVPVQYKDDGNEEWYEVCGAEKTTLIAIIGKDIDNEDVVITIDKKTCNLDLLLDLF